MRKWLAVLFCFAFVIGAASFAYAQSAGGEGQPVKVSPKPVKKIMKPGTGTGETSIIGDTGVQTPAGKASVIGDPGIKKPAEKGSVIGEPGVKKPTGKKSVIEWN
jgi:hypothetical protein